MIHPQKRMHVKKVLELVIRRILELKADLVRWNPPNSYLQMPSGVEEAFPWEYVHLDDILVDLKLSPDTLEITVPKYFREENASLLEQRDRLVSGYMRLKHNTDEIYVADEYETPVVVEPMTIERAMEIIQRNERGRQAMSQFDSMRDTTDLEMQRMLFSSSSVTDKDPSTLDMAVLHIQRSFKGFLGRHQAVGERENELMFIGMKPRKDNVDALDYELNIAYLKRKQEQIENKQIYETALDDLKDTIMDEEGPEKRNELREERTLWITDQIAQEKFPESLEDFYAGKMGLLTVNDASADAKSSSKKGKGGLTTYDG
jgi:IQ and AAA domain-containing protein